MAPIQDSLKLLLEEYESQFTKDETSIGTTPLTSMTIDTGTTDPVSQKPYPIAMKHYEWVKDEIEKLLTAKVICTSCSSWSAPIIVVPKGDGGKCLVIDYRALNKVTRKFTWPMPKVEDIFSKLNGTTYFTGTVHWFWLKTVTYCSRDYYYSSRFNQQYEKPTTIHTSPPWIFAQDIITFPWTNPLYPRQHSIHPLENMNM